MTVSPMSHPPDTGGLGANVSGKELAHDQDGNRLLAQQQVGADTLTLAPEETAPLLQDQSRSSNVERPFGDDVIPQEDQLVAKLEDHTTWQSETKILVIYSRSMIATFLLQYSLNATSLFSVGRLGAAELGAATLGNTFANMTGYVVYQGLATSLDTLCAQAFGAGQKKLVGLQLQRMVYFLWLVTIPIGIIWICGPYIFQSSIPEKEVAALTGLYLQILVLGTPGYAAFEAAKRYMQAQGRFDALLKVLLVCAPLNILMNWLFVWRLGWGFVGAPIAIALTQSLLPIVLFLHVRYLGGMECWGGFDRRSLQSWGPMVRLGLPGLLTMITEFSAFGILNLSASWISGAHLAAQSVISTSTAVTFRIAFSLSVVATTRIANLVGSGRSRSARTAARTALVTAIVLGCLNCLILILLRRPIARAITNDPAVVELAVQIFPLCGVGQILDAISANCNGVLRGIGKQQISGWTHLFCYYVICLPLSFGFAFGLHLGLLGLWSGPTVTFATIVVIEYYFIHRTDWESIVEDSKARLS